MNTEQNPVRKESLMDIIQDALVGKVILVARIDDGFAIPNEGDETESVTVKAVELADVASYVDVTFVTDQTEEGTLVLPFTTLFAAAPSERPAGAIYVTSVAKPGRGEGTASMFRYYFRWSVRGMGRTNIEIALRRRSGEPIAVGQWVSMGKRSPKILVMESAERADAFTFEGGGLPAQPGFFMPEGLETAVELDPELQGLIEKAQPPKNLYEGVASPL